VAADRHERGASEQGDPHLGRIRQREARAVFQVRFTGSFRPAKRRTSCSGCPLQGIDGSPKALASERSSATCASMAIRPGTFVAWALAWAGLEPARSACRGLRAHLVVAFGIPRELAQSHMVRNRGVLSSNVTNETSRARRSTCLPVASSRLPSRFTVAFASVPRKWTYEVMRCTELALRSVPFARQVSRNACSARLRAREVEHRGPSTSTSPSFGRQSADPRQRALRRRD